MTSPLFVGRVSEVGRLEASLRVATGGHPAFILVTGEAGIGKTRLITQVLTTRMANDIRILFGQCDPNVYGARPFAPIVAALLSYLHDNRDNGILDDPDNSLLTLLRGSPSIVNSGHDEDALRVDHGWMFSRLESVFEAVSGKTSLVLVVEDVHWADRTSLEFLAYLSRCARLSLAVLCTYRDDQPASPAFGVWLADIRRHARLTEIDVPPFTESEVREQIEGIMGKPPTGGLVASLYRRSSGNPYFTEMLLSSVDSAVQDPPESEPGVPSPLREVLLAPLAMVRADTRVVLEIMAVCGRQVAHAEITAAASILRISAAKVISALREAVDRHFVVAAGPDGYAFRHRLLAEALYDQMLPGERQQLHAIWATCSNGA